MQKNIMKKNKLNKTKLKILLLPLIIILIFIILFVEYNPIVMLRDIGDSHIKSNIINNDKIEKILTRDILKFLKDKNKKIINQEHILLNNIPVHSGMSYPKYYVYLKGYDDEKNIKIEGIAEASAVEGKSFIINMLFLKDEIDYNRMIKFFSKDVVLKILNNKTK